MKLNIGYIGFSEKAVYMLMDSERFILTGVIWEKARYISDHLVKALQEKKIPIYKVDNKHQAAEAIEKIACKQYLMYQFSYILPKEVAQRYKVFNIHPGDLRTNRGANPLIWTLLLREKNACMSLHQISEEIDGGLLVAERYIPVDMTDNSKTLLIKMENQIPDLIEELYIHLTKKTATTPIEGGIYRRRIQESDYTIDLSADSLEIILAKIRSQAAYRGAILMVDNIKFFVTGAEGLDHEVKKT